MSKDYEYFEFDPAGHKAKGRKKPYPRWFRRVIRRKSDGSIWLTVAALSSNEKAGALLAIWHALPLLLVDKHAYVNLDDYMALAPITAKQKAAMRSSLLRQLGQPAGPEKASQAN